MTPIRLLRHLPIPSLIAIGLTIAPQVCKASGSTYYVDFINGSDYSASTGASKTTPWQHVPGMAGAVGEPAAHVVAAGDRFIFKGGVTWTWRVWPWHISGGSASTQSVGCAGSGCVYYGVDRTWYDSAVCSAAGYSGFCRPIFSGGGWATVNVACNYDQNVAGNYMLVGSGQKYWIVDDLEFTGMCSSTGVAPYGVGSYILMSNGSGSDYFTISNSYFHGWTFNSTYTPSRTANPSPGDYTKCIIGATAGVANDEKHGEVKSNVFDGSDAPNASLLGYATGEGMYGGPGNVYFNVFKNLTESLDPADLITIHDNLFINGDAWSLSSGSNGAGIHEHTFNSTYDECNATIYDNVVVGQQAGEGLNPDIGANCNEFMFNNVVTDVSMAALGGSSYNAFLLSDFATGGTRYIFNNTCEGGPDSNDGLALGGPTYGCYRFSGSPISNNLVNNHTISSLSNGPLYELDSGTLDSVSDNVTQSQLAANAQGYSYGQTYQFSPISPGLATEGAGANVTSYCALIPDPVAQAACMNDTTYAVGYDAVNHNAVASGRTPNPRPAGGAWDAGAYQFNSSSATAGSNGAPAADLSNVRVYPNPYRPGSGSPEQGGGGTGIFFDQLPSSASIKIYTVSGSLVISFDASSATGAVNWDARNAKGRDVASGLYLAVLSSPGLKTVTKKILVVR